MLQPMPYHGIKMHRVIYSALIIFAFLFTSCAKVTDQSRANLLIFSASSLTNALGEIKEDFERENAVELSINYAGSSTLARQLLNGADAHLFISANRDWANNVEQFKSVLKRKEILGNQLVVITHQDSIYKPKVLSDLLDERIQHIGIANPAGVPAGIYAKKILVREGLWPQLKHKFIMGTDVRHTMAHVENGGAQVGFVYVTDALISSSTQISIDLSNDSSDDISYPILLLDNQKHKLASNVFYDYLSSSQGINTFKKYGFVVNSMP